MNRKEQIEKGMIVVYQALIAQRDIDTLIEDVFLMDKTEIDPYVYRVIQTAVANQTRYVGYIDQVLQGWTFERLGYIEKAILLNGCAEFDLKEQLSAKIIDGYVELAKKFCEEDTYKLINKVLQII